MIDLSNKATLIYCEHVTAAPLSSQVVIALELLYQPSSGVQILLLCQDNGIIFME